MFLNQTSELSAHHRAPPDLQQEKGKWFGDLRVTDSVMSEQTGTRKRLYLSLIWRYCSGRGFGECGCVWEVLLTAWSRWSCSARCHTGRVPAERCSSLESKLQENKRGNNFNTCSRVAARTYYCQIVIKGGALIIRMWVSRKKKIIQILK